MKCPARRFWVRLWCWLVGPKVYRQPGELMVELQCARCEQCHPDTLMEALYGKATGEKPPKPDP